MSTTTDASSDDVIHAENTDAMTEPSGPVTPRRDPGFGLDGSRRSLAGDAQGRAANRVFGGAAVGSGLLVVVLVTLIGVFLLAQAIPAIAADHDNFLLSRAWTTAEPMHFGVLQLLWTTVLSSVVALVFAIPLAIGIALFLTQYAPPWLARPAAILVDLLAAVPSIVYGLWGASAVVHYWQPIQSALQNSLGGFLGIFAEANGITTGNTIFLVGLVLAIMVLPIITALAREVFSQTPAMHKEAALALGATKWEMIRITVLPFGRAGVISASMLGLGRALGETIAVMMILSALPDGTKWSWSLFNGGETFASKIASDAAEFTGGLSTGAYIAAGLVLFVLTFIVNAVARVIIERQGAKA